jgi:hypothetical protein
LGWQQIEVSASDGKGNLMAQTTTDANGDFRLWGLSMETVTLQFHAPAWIILDGATLTVEAPAGMMAPTLPRARHTTAITGAWVALNTPWLAGTLIP